MLHYVESYGTEQDAVAFLMKMAEIPDTPLGEHSPLDISTISFNTIDPLVILSFVNESCLKECISGFFLSIIGGASCLQPSRRVPFPRGTFGIGTVPPQSFFFSNNHDRCHNEYDIATN